MPEKLCYELQALRVYSEKRDAATVIVAVAVAVDVATLRCVVFRGKSVSLSANLAQVETHVGPFFWQKQQRLGKVPRARPRAACFVPLSVDVDSDAGADADCVCALAGDVKFYYPKTHRAVAFWTSGPHAVAAAAEFARR